MGLVGELAAVGMGWSKARNECQAGGQAAAAQGGDQTIEDADVIDVGGSRGVVPGGVGIREQQGMHRHGCIDRALQ